MAGGFAPVPPPSADELRRGVWGIENRPIVPTDANAGAFPLHRAEVLGEVAQEPSTQDAAAGEPTGVKPRWAVIGTDASELRPGMDGAALDCTVDAGGAWVVTPLAVLGGIADAAEAELTWRDGLRGGTDLSDFYDGTVDGEAAWRIVLPNDAIATDSTTAQQEAVLAARSARGGALSEAVKARRRDRLQAYFTRRTRPSGGGKRPAAVVLPSAAFGRQCIVLASEREMSTKRDQRAAEEAAARETLEREGAWFTLWPTAARRKGGGDVCPAPSCAEKEHSGWAARHGVVFSLTGFAFASHAAMERMDARMARRARARETQTRAAAARAAEAGVRAARRISLRGAIEELRVLRAPPTDVTSVVAALLVLSLGNDEVDDMGDGGGNKMWADATWADARRALRCWTPYAAAVQLGTFTSGSYHDRAAIARTRPLLESAALAPRALVSTSVAAARLAAWAHAAVAGRLMYDRRAHAAAAGALTKVASHLVPTVASVGKATMRYGRPAALAGRIAPASAGGTAKTATAAAPKEPLAPPSPTSVTAALVDEALASVDEMDLAAVANSADALLAKARVPVQPLRRV